MKQLKDFPPQDVQKARETVAAFWQEMLDKILKEDGYADHVTQFIKMSDWENGMRFAKEIAEGKHDGNFTVWQRIYEVLTGECVAFLPKE